MGQEREWETCAHSAPASFFSVSTTGCRRAASFPFFGDSALQSPSLKVRSQSESEGLNRMRINSVKFETLRQRLGNPIDENDEGSDYGSKHSSSSSECDANDTSDFCAGQMDDEDTEKEEESECPRKSVRFADDCGKDLYCIRIATEPSDCPPKLSPSVLRRYRGESFEEDSQHEPAPVWNLNFKQPAAEYVRFREKLEKDKVSLENVIVKAEEYKVHGVIKVSNISFEKSVFIRYTMNGWLSHTDKQAVYQPSTSKIHDTFKFELELPHCVERVNKIEFCVCFIAGGVEHWDSNGGMNYQLECEVQHVQPRRTPLFGGTKYLDRDDAYKLDYTDWSKFAAWKSLSTDGPYW
ncbi:unnamed protein product [Caenorhabditis auriculariae]|uniref:Protein phosphatase 1 regulatory subunit n=1 Tax=Caenorhabditis auriculariae TaxID=2777116 RepID=A0A8S1H652_9PELO|nr:unnamed protein product [Caenorhabditis auriculariae]